MEKSLPWAGAGDIFGPASAEDGCLHLRLVRKCVSGTVDWEARIGGKLVCSTRWNCVPSHDLVLRSWDGTNLLCGYTNWQMDGQVRDKIGCVHALFDAPQEETRMFEYRLAGGPTLVVRRLAESHKRVEAAGVCVAEMTGDAPRPHEKQDYRTVDKAANLLVAQRLAGILPHLVLCLVL